MIRRREAVGFISAWVKLTGENREVLLTLIDCLGGLWNGDGDYREKIDSSLILTMGETERTDPTSFVNASPRWASPGVHHAVAEFLRKLADGLESGEEYLGGYATNASTLGKEDGEK